MTRKKPPPPKPAKVNRQGPPNIIHKKGQVPQQVVFKFQHDDNTHPKKNAQ